MKYSPDDGLSIVLDDPIDNPVEQMKFLFERREWPVIDVALHDGRFVRLHSCISMQRDSENATLSVFANHGVVGFGYGKSDSEYVGLRVFSKDVSALLLDPPFTCGDGGEHGKFSVGIAEAAETYAADQDTGISIRRRHRVARQWDNDEGVATISSECVLEVLFLESRRLDDVMKDVGFVAGFVSSIVGRHVRLDRVDLIPPKNAPVTTALGVLYLARTPRLRKSERRELKDSVRRVMANIDRAWPEYVGNIRLYHELLAFLDSAQGDNLSDPRLRVLVVAQAIEVLHRRTRSGVYMAEQEYQSVDSQLVDAIPQFVGKSHREALKARIKYGNEVSLRRRMKELVVDCPAIMTWLRPLDSQSFISYFVDLRNTYTHYPEPEDEPSSLEVDYFAAMVARVIVRAHILSSLGTPKDEILLSLEEDGMAGHAKRRLLEEVPRLGIDASGS